jgi:hypothetical protein
VIGGLVGLGRPYTPVVLYGFENTGVAGLGICKYLKTNKRRERFVVVVHCLVRFKVDKRDVPVGDERSSEWTQSDSEAAKPIGATFTAEIPYL